jgi:hypothetical protein
MDPLKMSSLFSWHRREGGAAGRAANPDVAAAVQPLSCGGSQHALTRQPPLHGTQGKGETER